MKIEQHATGQNIQELEIQADRLAEKAKQISQENAKMWKDTGEKMDGIETEVDTAIARIEQTFSELDQVEKNAENELDSLMLRQAEDLASDK